VNRDSESKLSTQPLRTRLREVTAATILDAAELVFSERGLQARLDDVAAQAGVAVGTLYNYFADRQALVEALLAAHRANLRERLSAIVVCCDDLPFRERLEAILAEMVVVSLPKLRLRLLLLQAAPQRTTRYAETRAWLGSLIGPVLEKARQANELVDDPNGLQLQLLIGLTHSLLAASQESPPLLAPEALPKTIASAFLDGVGRHSSR
jgi:AcrR family transcriptional regulator